MYIPKDKKSYIERFRKIAKEYHRKKAAMVAAGKIRNVEIHPK